ncbi:MAG: SGNH/GDSL hydrolase family protein [Phycisphaerae bacterium]
MPERRSQYTNVVIGATVVACSSFWILPPPWNRTILGLYSPKWFIGSLVANLCLIALCASLVRRPRPTRVDGKLSTGKKLFFTAVLVLPLVGLTEWGLNKFYFPSAPRMARPDAGTFDRYHATLQHVDRINVDGKVQRAYRGKVYPSTSERYRVVCLGGSTTWGHHLDRGDSWPYLLEQRLIDAGHDVEVINAGRHWYTSVHSLTNYVSYVRYLNPDMVVIMHGVNDLARDFPQRGEPDVEWDYGSYQGPMRNVLAGYRSSLHEPSWTISHPVLWFKDLAIVRLFRETTGRWNDGVDEADVPIDDLQSIQSHEAHLTYLTDLVQQDGATVVLATQAHIYGAEEAYAFPKTMRSTYMRTRDGRTVSRRSVGDAMRAVRQNIMRLASAGGYTLADVERAVGHASAYFMDDFHLNAKGNHVAAEAVFSAVDEIIKDAAPERIESASLEQKVAKTTSP